MKKGFLFGFLLVSFITSPAWATFLPPFVPVQGGITPTAVGQSKITALARSVADVVCLAGINQGDKWFPVNLRRPDGFLTSWFVKIEAGCTPFSSYSFTQYEGYGAWYHRQWGFGTPYIQYCTMVPSVDGHDCNMQSGTLNNHAHCNDFSPDGISFADAPSSGQLRLTGRWIHQTSNVTGGSGGWNYTYCSLTSSTGSLIISQSDRAENQAIYLPGYDGQDLADMFKSSSTYLAVGDGTGQIYSTTTIQGTQNDADVYNAYNVTGYLPLTPDDVLSSTPPIVNMSTWVITTNISVSSVLSVDLSSTNAKLDILNNSVNGVSSNTSQTNSLLTDIKNLLSPSTITFSTSAVWGQYQDFVSSFSNIPINLFSFLIPASTETWRPCFDMTGLWSGLWAGSKPSGSSGEFCLSDFAGWNVFISILHCVFFLIFAYYGLVGIWNLLMEGRLPGILSSGRDLLLTAIFLTTMVALSFWVMSVLNNFVQTAVVMAADCVSGCTGLSTPTELVMMFNYTGLTAALQLFLTLLQVRFEMWLFLNFWGAIRK